jgi:hypothetical protein
MSANPGATLKSYERVRVFFRELAFLVDRSASSLSGLVGDGFAPAARLARDRVEHKAGDRLTIASRHKAKPLHCSWQLNIGVRREGTAPRPGDGLDARAAAASSAPDRRPPTGAPSRSRSCPRRSTRAAAAHPSGRPPRAGASDCYARSFGKAQRDEARRRDARARLRRLSSEVRCHRAATGAILSTELRTESLACAGLFCSSPGWTRTNNPPVNSRMLCQLSYRGTG